MILTKTLALVAALAWAPLAGAAGGGGGGDGPPSASASSNDPDFQAGVAAWKSKDWPQVLARMQTVVQREPNNADAWNYMGHAARQNGDLDGAFRHYERALQIDPKHRAAHEYAGEAWLIAGRLAKAEEHLKALDKLCFLPCEEYTDLKAKVAEYKRSHPK